MFNLSLLDLKKIKNRMREGGKKNIGYISRKVNEGDEIKKLLTHLKKKLMRATNKNKQKNIAVK